MKKSAMEVFRRMPGPLRRTVVHAVAPSYTVGAVAVLRRGDGRLVLVEQRHSLGWALPGGLLGRGESPAAALARELEEELGLALDPGSLPVPFAAVSPSVRRVDIVFCLDLSTGSGLPGGEDVEVTRCGWFALDELPEITESTADILRAVRLL